MRADVVMSIRDSDALAALSHPLRLRILEELREPRSAASVARRIGEARQKVHYHLKELEKAGLVEAVGERRAGNFVETLYQASANSFVIAPEAVWGDRRRADVLRSQVSLENLLAVGERLQREAVALLDRAAFDGEEIASAAVTLDIAFADEGSRAAFLRDYVAAVRRLVDEYGAADGEPYRAVLATHPVTEGSES